MMRADALTHTGSIAVSSDRRFFMAMSIVTLAVVFLGFSTSYYLWPLTRATHYPNGRPISPTLPLIVHVHAVAFSAWIVLFAAQVALVASGRTATHRRLGIISAWLVPILIVAGILTAIRGARDGWSPAPVFVDALSFMAVPLGDIVVFTALVVGALVFRERPELHKRLMLLGTVGGLTWPAITRIPTLNGRFLPMLTLFAALVLAPAARDFWNASKQRWVTLFVGLGIIASILMRPLIGSTAAWRAFADWLVK
jgi:hypothetical protein